MDKKMVERVTADNADFSPRLLYSHLFQAKGVYAKGTKLPGRYVADYEIEFFLFSDGAMWINDKLYTMKRGDIIFRRPGDWTQAILPYDCYCIFFDLLGKTKKNPKGYNFDIGVEFQYNYINHLLDQIPVQFPADHSEQYLHLFDGILKEFINPSECSALLIKADILRILSLLYTEVKNPFSNKNSEPNSQHEIIKEAINYIQHNLENKIKLEHIAKVCSLSPNYFHTLFTKIMNETPNEYIQKLRLAKAKEMLVKTRDPVSEVASMCGYDSLSYFSYAFRNHVGVSPNQFRKKYDRYL